MAGPTVGRRLIEFYLRRSKLVGALYCAVPVVVGYAILFASALFRPVYILRLILSLLVGGAAGAFVNSFGLSLWLAKHRSSAGPATVLDGAFIGAAVGLAASLLPPLISLIATHHLEQVKSLIICAWLAALVIGAIVGALLAVVGRRCVERPLQNGREHEA